MVADIINTKQSIDDDLPDAFLRAHQRQRPLLTHLNADTTWLLSLPCSGHRASLPGRAFYNILIDPWLKGSQSDVASWFSTQWHVVESSVQSIIELNALLHKAESVCLGEEAEKSWAPNGLDSNYIDLVAVCHEFTDHCHEATLKEIVSSVPVFATPKAKDLIQSWKHFDTVVETPAFKQGTDWHDTSVKPLPDWLGVSRLITEGNSLYYHSALIICANKEGESGAEAVIYTPHGVEHETFSAVATAQPRLQTLALLHGLHDVSIRLSKQLNLGLQNALKAQKVLQARYWVGTHDEVKKGGGFIGPLLRRKAWTIADALLPKEETAADVTDNSTRRVSGEDVSYVDLANGKALLLE